MHRLGGIETAATSVPEPTHDAIAIAIAIAAAFPTTLDVDVGVGSAADQPPSPPDLKLAEQWWGATPERVASNATAASRTDPDAKLRHKSGHRKHLVHRGQVAVDPKHR